MATIQIKVDSEPLISFLEILKRFSQVIDSAVDLPDFPDCLVRTESDRDPTNADVLIVRFYPSDALLRFSAAVFALNRDLDLVRET